MTDGNHEQIEKDIKRIAESLEKQTRGLVAHMEDDRNIHEKDAVVLAAIHAKLDEILVVIDPLKDAMVFTQIGMRMLMNSTKVIGWILAIGALLSMGWKVFMYAITQTK